MGILSGHIRPTKDIFWPFSAYSRSSPTSTQHIRAQIDELSVSGLGRLGAFADIPPGAVPLPGRVDPLLSGRTPAVQERSLRLQTDKAQTYRPPIFL
eukprot:3979273-Pleurochrysis_carterae.AAC.1